MSQFVVTQGFLGPTDITQGYAGSSVVTPVADFSATPLSGAIPLSVQFTDLSTNTPTSWLWDFGDGNTSTLQNPAHVYTVAGTFTVQLTATNAAGSGVKIKPNYITVSAPVAPTQPAVTGGGGGNRLTKKRKWKEFVPIKAEVIAKEEAAEVPDLARIRRRRRRIAVALMMLGDI